MNSTGPPPVIGRLPGAIELFRPGVGSNMIMWQLCWNPSPGVTTPDESPREWVIAAAFPCSSITLVCVVSDGGSLPRRLSPWRSRSSTWRRRSVGVLLGEEALDREVDEVGIAEQLHPIAECKMHRARQAAEVVG